MIPSMIPFTRLYSHGMRKKVVLASALIHRPDVLVLDEPFEGIDPVSSSAIRDVLQRYRVSGGTVLFSSQPARLGFSR